MVRMLNQPDPPEIKIYKKMYDSFKGVDFSTDSSRINDSRSPDAVNMISDAGGFPVKRLGWRVLWDMSEEEETAGAGGESGSTDGATGVATETATEPSTDPGLSTDPDAGMTVHGLFFYENDHYLAHVGDSLYRWSEEQSPVLLRSGLCDGGRSTAFLYDGKLYILTGEEYLVYGEFDNPDYDEETNPDAPDVTVQLKDVADVAYVPTTTTLAAPAGGGESLQDVNLLTPKRKNLFVGDGTSKTYQLDAKEIDAVEEVKVDGTVYDSSRYTVDEEEGTVSFTTAPPEPGIVGTPNVEITFSKTVEGYADRIAHCDIAAIYANRVFFAGNPSYPNADYASALNDPAYVPDLSYTEIGNDGAAIMGYLRLGDSLAIIKEDNTQDATVFLRSTSLTSTEAVFPVKQGISGIGAVSRACFANLIDDPLFLTRRGVYAVATQVVTLERTMQSRSSFVNARLEKENLAAACAVEWNGYYLLAAGDHVYVADSRQRSYTNNVTGTYEYEWYYWENVPAHVWLEDKGSLYFGTRDGRICKFNTDLLDSKGDPLMSAYHDDGEAILARWSTPVSDDNSFMTYKTMPKRGCGLYLKTYISSSAKIYIVTDKDFGKLIRQTNAGIFDFEQVDFANFTFNTLPQNVIPFNKKTKKYKTVQIVVENDAAGEGFGLFAIERRYFYGTSVKR